MHIEKPKIVHQAQVIAYVSLIADLIYTAIELSDY